MVDHICNPSAHKASIGAQVDVSLAYSENIFKKKKKRKWGRRYLHPKNSLKLIPKDEEENQRRPTLELKEHHTPL